MGDDALLYLEYLRDTGQVAEAQEYEQYLRETGLLKSGPATPDNSPGQQPNRRLLAPASSTRVGREPSNGHETLSPKEAILPLLTGIGASASQAIPGVEALQAGARSVVRGQPYTEALSDIRGATDQVPTGVKLAVQTPAMLAMGYGPLSPLKAGAAIGGASQALDADPASIAERAGRTVAGAAAGGAAGYIAGDIAAPLARAWAPGRPSPGNLVQKMKEKMRTVSGANYGRADAEAIGATAPAQAAVRRILERPDIKPFAEMVRSRRQYATASDAQVLGEVYRQMSRQQRGLTQRITRDGYDAKLALDAENIGLAKDELLNAADAAMPSFRGAVEAHRGMASEIGAVGTGVDAAKRIMGAAPSGPRLATQSAEAYAERLRRMTRQQREAAVRGVLGHLRTRTGFQPNAVSLGGLLTTVKRPTQAAAFLRDAGDEGQVFSDYLVKVGLAGGATGGR